MNSQFQDVSVLSINLMPVPDQQTSPPMAWSTPPPFPEPYPYPGVITATVQTEIRLVKCRAILQKEVEIINGTRDFFKPYGIDLILTVTLEVYSRNGTLIFKRTLTFDGGMQRTIKIYRTDFEDLQPLKVVLQMYLKLIYKGSTIFEKTFRIERDGITIQT